jgi:hypothetical protein
VRRRRQVVSLVTACLGTALVISCAAKSAKLAGPDDPCALERPVTQGEPVTTNNCRPGMHDRDALLRGGFLRDGLVHFRIAYNWDVEPLQKRAFRKAMAMWNCHRRRTGFVFEDTTTAEVDFRLQRGAPAHLPDADEVEKKECSGYMSAGSYIWYSPKAMDWVKHDIDIPIAARIYAHELGHALNIWHKDGISVMREGDSGMACQHVGAVIVADIQDSDVLDAHTCACDVRRGAQTQPSAPRR